MSMEGRATKIGVVTATISAMTVDLVGPRGAFGRLDVPAIKIGAFGADITIVDQWITIVDMEAFASFVQAIVGNEDLILRLENGVTTVKSMGMKSSIVYRKSIHLHGLKRLQTSLLGLEQSTNSTNCIISLVNPSQFEVDLGTVVYKVQDGSGRNIGEVRGATYVQRGPSTLSLCGHITGLVSSSGETKLIGVDVEEENWLKQIIGSVNVTVSI